MATAFRPTPTIRLLGAQAPSRRSNARNSGVTRANSAAVGRIGRYLQSLRAAGRRAVSIVDLDCGDGAVALAAARKARILGFLAITVRGFDTSGEKVHTARRRAAAVEDPAIGCTFETRSARRLPVFEEGEADLLLLGSDELPAQDVARIRDPSGVLVRHV